MGNNLCPLLEIAARAGGTMGGAAYGIGETCAWWSVGSCSCAIRALAEGLEQMEADLAPSPLLDKHPGK